MASCDDVGMYVCMYVGHRTSFERVKPQRRKIRRRRRRRRKITHEGVWD
jgi:hypothetical protein